MKFGIKARDIVTGFTGTVVGRAEYMTGCEQVLLVPPVGADGKLAEGSWFDVQRVEPIAETPEIKVTNGRRRGGDIAPARRV